MREGVQGVMKNETLTTVSTIISTDVTIPKEQQEHILKACRQASPTKKRLGTVRQAAQLFTPPVHPRTVQRYGKRGLLHPIKISARCVRWNLDQVAILANEGVKNEEA